MLHILGLLSVNTFRCFWLLNIDWFCRDGDARWNPVHGFAHIWPWPEYQQTNAHEFARIWPPEHQQTNGKKVIFLDHACKKDFLYRVVPKNILREFWGQCWETRFLAKVSQNGQNSSNDPKQPAWPKIVGKVSLPKSSTTFLGHRVVAMSKMA